MRPSWEPPRLITGVLCATAVTGALAFAAGLALSPARAWANLLVAGFYVLGLALAGTFFVALQHVARAGWSTALRRVPEAMSAALPVAAILLGAVAIGGHEIYEWTHAEALEAHPVLAAKRAWLDLPLLLGRAAICFAIWVGLSSLLARHSRCQDADRDPRHGRAATRLSALFLVLFAPTFSVACFDWIMSLEPEWYSTIFALYGFGGLFESGIAAIAILVIALRRLGPLRGVVTEEHLHDLGKLLFAFSTFWAYLWFSQYMLIWYANIPEETTHFADRSTGGWQSLAILNVVLGWLLPFVLLLPRSAKRSETMLLRVSVLVLAAHWLDLYLSVLRPTLGASPSLGPLEVLPFAGALSLFALVFFRALGKAEIVPVGDPTLGESLHHHA